MATALLLHACWAFGPGTVAARADSSSASDSMLTELCTADNNSIPVVSSSPVPAGSPTPAPSLIPLSGSAASQKQQYCSAGQAAQKAAQADSKVWIIYAAASAVCTAACGASLAKVTIIGAAADEYACTGAAVGAGVTDAIWTKNYMTAIEAIGGAAAGYVLKSTGVMGGGSSTSSAASSASSSTASTAGSTASGAGGTAAAGGAGANGASTASNGVQTNIGACISAATTAYSAFSKHQDETSSEGTVTSSVQSLESLASTAAAAAAANSIASGVPLGGSTSGSNATQSGGTSGSTVTAATAGTGSSSGGLASCADTTASGAIACAATAGGENMPAFVTSPGFGNAVQNATGMSLPQFMAAAQNSGPSAAISSGLSKLGGDATNAMNGVLSAMAGRQFGENADATYASGGGGGGGGSGNNEMASMVSNLLGQIAPKKGDDNKNALTKEMAFGEVNRTLASKTPEEDRSISLFTRVALRYASLTPRMLAPAVTATTEEANLPPLPTFTK